jgi:hypothetical protein
VQAHPGLMAASMPWLSGVDFKRLCTWFPYVTIVLVLTRDKGCGRVTIGRDGLPRLHYWPDTHDRASMMDVSLPLMHPFRPPLHKFLEPCKSVMVGSLYSTLTPSKK